MTNRIWTQTLLVSLLATTMSLAQFESRDVIATATMDSFLLAKDVDSLRRLLAEQVKFLESTSADKASGYNELLRKLGQLSDANEERFREISHQFAETKSRFNPEYAGQSAHLAFEKFLVLLKEQHWKEAVGIYFIASYFRNRNFQEVKLRLLSKYSIAHELYAIGKYEEALNAVEEFRKEDPAAPAYIALKDSLTDLYRKINEGSSKGLAVQRVELASEIVINRFSLSTSAYLAMYPENADLQMVFYNIYNSTFDWQIQTLRQRQGKVLSVQMDYLFHPNFSVGGRVFWGTIYDMDIPEDFLSRGPTLVTHIKESFICFNAIVEWYFREKSGGRPYLGVGAGFVNIRRDRAEIKSPPLDIADYKAIEELKVSYPVVTTEIGFEYEPGSDAFWYAALMLSLMNHFGDSAVLPHFIFAGGLRVGLKLL